MTDRDSERMLLLKEIRADTRALCQRTSEIYEAQMRDRNRLTELGVRLNGVRPGELSGVSALLLEDDQRLLNMLTQQFVRGGATVYPAAAAIQARIWVERGMTPNVALVDSRLGGEEDGPEFCEWLRVACPTLPIIITSGGDVDSALIQRFGAYWIPKPYGFRELVDMVRTVTREADTLPPLPDDVT